MIEYVICVLGLLYSYVGIYDGCLSVVCEFRGELCDIYGGWDWYVI